MLTTMKQIRAAAAVVARGQPDVERSPYDCYLLEQGSGKWQAEACGLVVGSGISRDRAELLLAEHGAGRPVWLVEMSGTAELLKATA